MAYSKRSTTRSTASRPRDDDDRRQTARAHRGHGVPDDSGTARAGRERRGPARPGRFRRADPRALAEEIGDADSITIEARDMALFKDLAAQMVLASAAAAIDGAAAAGAGSSA